MARAHTLSVLGMYVLETQTWMKMQVEEKHVQDVSNAYVKPETSRVR